MFKVASILLTSVVLFGSVASFAQTTIDVKPSTDTSAVVQDDGSVAVAPNTTVVLQPGTAAVVTQTAPVNVGLEGIVAWKDTVKGPAWVNVSGMALYNYDPDTDGTSHCTGDCAVAWPPLKAEANIKGTDEWTVVAREDGTSQWAYKGHPLYLFAKDTAPGEVNGDGVAGFHLAD